MAEREFDALHEDQPWHDGTFTVWGEKFSAMTPWHVRDGMTVYLAEYDENPDDLFTTDKFAKPTGFSGSVAEQAPSDQG